MEAGERSKWRARLWRYGPVVVWMSVIFFASTGSLSASNTSRIVRPLLLWLFPDITEEGLMQAHFLVRKGAHLTEYAILAMLAARAFLTSANARLRHFWYAFALALVVAYALLDEFHQSFVQTRTGTIYDSLIDITGGACGLLLVWAWRKRRGARAGK
ncbi:MAG TPA: VanZ family protein [Pyrinomonadaceae bacterium]|nr:VanZ family protein [Pyrinomonadaceae bacterium]